MKKILILICMVGLGFLLAWVVSDDSSQQKAELESLNAELQQLKTDIGKTEIERDTLKVRIVLVEQNRDKLQEQVDELAGLRDRMQEQADKLTFSRDQSRQQLAEIIGSRDKLKQQLTELTNSRNQLQKQVDELTRSRDTAVADAQAAQKRIDKLVAMLDTETQKFSEPQDKLVVTNQAQEDTQPPMIEISEYPAAPTEVSRPAVVPSQAGEPAAMMRQHGERPTCHSFNTTRPQILPGQTSTLSWQVSNADKIRIEPEIGPVSALGSRTVKLFATTTYTLIAINRAGESRITRRIDVGKAPAVQRQAIEQPAVLTEAVEPPVVGSQAVEPPVVNSKVSDLPTLHSFNTTRPVIMPGQTSTLSWQVSNAERIRIEPEVGPVSDLGSRTVKPSATTTYTLIATNQAGDSRLSRKVEVSEHITIFSSDSTRPQVLLEEYRASDDSKVLSEQKTQVSDPNATLGKFLGYRARKDESGKFIFIPVFENKQEE
jgi:hypothetical protein